MRLTILFKALVYLILVISCAVAAWSFWQSDQAKYTYAYDTDFIGPQDLRESIYAKTQGDRYLRSQVPPDLDNALEMYRLALTLSPYSPLHWRDYSEALMQSNQMDEAMQALEMAEYLAPNDHHIHMEMGNLLLQQGDIDAAAASHHRAIRLHASLAPAIYPVYLGLGWSAMEVAEKILTDDQAALNRYFGHCLTCMGPAEAEALWDGLVDLHGPVMYAGSYSQYFDYLIAASEYLSARLLWEEILAQFYHIDPATLSEEDKTFWNGAFQYLPLFEGALEWRIFNRMPVETRASIITSNHLSSNRRLHISFGGKENIRFNHVERYFFVEPGATYRLSYHVNAMNIITENGPYVRVTLYSDPPEMHRGRVIRHTGDWRLSQDFYNASAHWAKITICRDLSDKLSNRIQGNVWFDNFTLEIIERRPSLMEGDL